MMNIERDSLFRSSMSLMISIIIITTSMILLEIGLNNHHIAIAQQNKSMVLGGVHSPELEFGKNYTNARSVTKTGLSHPVIRQLGWVKIIQ